MYYWRCKSEPRPTITEFLASGTVQLLKRKGYDLYTSDNKVVIDKICRFENLSEELERICTRLGFPEKLTLPRTKSVFRKDKRHYRDILNKSDQMTIAELFSDEIYLFNYRF